MKKGLKFAAIDIGSNAIRLLFTRVIENNSKTYFIKESLIRMPIRLGEDAFSNGFISDRKSKSLFKTMLAFSHLLSAYTPIKYRACATAAMRYSSNKNSLIDEVCENTGIVLEVISGKEEADLIFSNHIEGKIDSNNNYLYIDVGGGSTELTIIKNKKRIISNSFSIGSVRLLNNNFKENIWNELEHWIKVNTVGLSKIISIGSGGNINKIFSIVGKRKDKIIKKNDIEIFLKSIDSYSVDDRVTLLGYRPDRADVISFAAQIYLNCMGWSNSEEMIVPQSGLSDGIVRSLYADYKK